VSWVGVPENDMTAVLLIELVAEFSNALTASPPETTGNFIRLEPQ